MGSSRLGLVLLVLLGLTCGTHGQSIKKRERARLPQWKSFPEHVFFRDAFKEGLVGTRPAKLGQSLASAESGNATPAKSDANAAKGFAWSQLVSSTTLEDEIKALQIKTQKTISTPSRFSAGGYLEARKMFTELATLFAVVAEYDRDVRWKKDALVARELFARAAANTKTTSIQAFNESRERKQDLEELVRGGTIVNGRKPSDAMQWELIHRGSLMKRFTTSYDEGLVVWVSNDDEFKKNAENIRRESELLLVFTEALKQDGMQDGDDEDYEAYCQQFGEAVREVLDTLELEDGEGCRKAVSNVGQACIACHDDYRG